MKFKDLAEVKAYLDLCSAKSLKELPDDFYIRLDNFFVEQGSKQINMDIRYFIYKDYMDKNITFRKMISKLKKSGAKFKKNK